MKSNPNETEQLRTLVVNSRSYNVPKDVVEALELVQKSLLREIDENAELKRSLLRLYRAGKAEHVARMRFKRMVFGHPPTDITPSEWMNANNAALELLKKHGIEP